MRKTEFDWTQYLFILALVRNSTETITLGIDQLRTSPMFQSDSYSQQRKLIYYGRDYRSQSENRRRCKLDCFPGEGKHKVTTALTTMVNLQSIMSVRQEVLPRWPLVNSHSCSGSSVLLKSCWKSKWISSPHPPSPTLLEFSQELWTNFESLINNTFPQLSKYNDEHHIRWQERSTLAHRQCWSKVRSAIRTFISRICPNGKNLVFVIQFSWILVH